MDDVGRYSGVDGFRPFWILGSGKQHFPTIQEVLTFIVNETIQRRALWHSPCCPLPHHLSDILPRTYMSSLIEGWFQLANGRSFVDNTPDTTTSPRKNKSYLSVFDSCAVLGSIPSEVFVESELRLYPGNHVLDKTVIHAHGRFAIVTADDDSDPSLQAEIHRFVIMDAINPSDDNTPEGLRTSVTLSGRVTAADAASGAGDKFFTLEVSDYVRDHTQTFSIRFVLFLIIPDMS